MPDQLFSFAAFLQFETRQDLTGGEVFIPFNIGIQLWVVSRLALSSSACNLRLSDAVDEER